MLNVRWFCGVDPHLSGLHGIKDVTDGRDYRDTGHVCYPFHLADRPAADRVPTVVLPLPAGVEVIVHELGHVLDYWLGFEHDAAPVTRYAMTNRYEAFAEAFTAHTVESYAPVRRGFQPIDSDTRYLLADCSAA